MVNPPPWVNTENGATLQDQINQKLQQKVREYYGIIVENREKGKKKLKTFQKLIK